MRYLDLTLPEINSNLALDEALLIAAEEREAGPSLRVWESPTLAVVLGASGRLHEDVLVDACQADGVAIARRASGGGTVLIGPGALNVSVVLAADVAPGLTAVDLAQRFVLSRLADAIRARGPAVEILGQGDLTLDLRKFSGSAQRRLRNHFLVHASILYDFPLHLIPRYTGLPRRQPPYRGQRTHEDFLTNLPLTRENLLEAITGAWLPADRRPELMNPPEDLIHDLLAAKFADPAWIERL